RNAYRRRDPTRRVRMTARSGASPSTSAGREPALAQEREHGHHPAVHVGLLGELELVEQGVDVLLDRALGQEERAGDRRVVLALRHLLEDLALPLRQMSERRAPRALPPGDE